MELVKVTNSWLIVKCNGHFQATILLYLLTAFLTSLSVCLSISFSLSLHLYLTPTPSFPLPFLFLWLVTQNMSNPHTLVASTTSPILMPILMSNYLLILLWMFHSYLNVSFFPKQTHPFTSFSCILYLHEENVILSAFKLHVLDYCFLPLFIIFTRYIMSWVHLFQKVHT